MPENAVYGKRMFSFDDRVRDAVDNEVWELKELERRAVQEIASQKRAALRAELLVAAKERRTAQRREQVERRRLFEEMRAQRVRVLVREFAQRLFESESRVVGFCPGQRGDARFPIEALQQRVVKILILNLWT